MEYKKDYKKPYKKKTTAPKVKYKPKRGKLAPLMTEDQKKDAGIHELSYDFGCRITRLFQYLTEDSDYIKIVARGVCSLYLCKGDLESMILKKLMEFRHRKK